LHFHSITDAGLEKHKTANFPTTALLKLSVVSSLIVQYERVVYLDGDVLIFNDLSLETVDLGDKILGAVIDLDPRRVGSLKGAGPEETMTRKFNAIRYFNSGFLLFCQRHWDHTAMERYTDSLTRHDVSCNYRQTACGITDQCALNMTFAGQWMALPAGYNAQSPLKFNKLWKTAAVRHYCGVRKFVPISYLRNDARDLRLIAKIRRMLGLTGHIATLWPELLYRLNVMRNFRLRLTMRRMLDDLSLS
jgi:lipopolysaccharide biosynthesis glycosyltransferase